MGKDGLEERLVKTFQVMQVKTVASKKKSIRGTLSEAN